MKNKIITKIIAICISCAILINSSIYANAKIGLKEIENSVNIMKDLTQFKYYKASKTTGKTDFNYIIKALNMVTPYVYDITGITENLRLYNVNINHIKIDKIPGIEGLESRLYNKDEGEGSINVMRCLFPSSSGILSSEGNVSCCSNNCNPTPELISKIAKFLYDVRNDSQDIKKYLENHEKYPSKFTIQDFLKQYFDKKGEFSKGKNSKTLFCLLKNMTYMIVNEESDKKIQQKLI